MNYVPSTKADRSRVNILIQEVVSDTMIDSLFYGKNVRQCIGFPGSPSFTLFRVEMSGTTPGARCESGSRS